MKISQTILANQANKKPWCSFEFFPPKTSQGLLNLYERMERMTELGPIFIDVTWGAGGSSADTTTQIVRTAHEQLGLETCMHLTCTNMPVSQVHQALLEAKEHGCENILALRGDPPRGQEEWTADENGFQHAVDLVKYIKKHFGDSFDIAIAGFPEGHPHSSSREEELRHVKAKVDAGATFIITQMFYDADVFIQWARDLRAIGVNVPIVPGIMPIQSYSAFIRRTSFAKTIIPQWFLDELEPVKEDDARVRDIGTKLVVDMCTKILSAQDLEICGFHFYTMNLEKGVRMLLEELNFVPSVDVVNPLPWRPALTEKRRQETTRPIFWSNRHKSYLARTEAWDEFPNGRWGNARSAAYGDLDGYGISLKYERNEARKIWGYPTSIAEVNALFVAYCRGQVPSLPWSDQPMARETTAIAQQLTQLNEMGYLTINSQPPVDGADSSDPNHGWGPKDGYVYQKAYLEFFCSPDQFPSLVKRLLAAGSTTYYAVTKNGDLHTNTTLDAPNAVTWGCFPGKEIVQPTIVERLSFMAWKDEAFELGNLWAGIYDEGSESRKVIQNIFDTYYLVNIVRNDYRNPDTFAIFKPFLAETPTSNGFASHDIVLPQQKAIDGLTEESLKTRTN